MTCIPRAEPFNGCAGGAMEKWPKRLGAVPPRIASGEMKWLSIQRYEHDTLIWVKRVNFYLTYLKYLSNGVFTTKSLYNAMTYGGVRDKLCTLIWKSKIPLKV